MKKECMTCKNAVLLTGGMTGTQYLECNLVQKLAKMASYEELMWYHDNPEELPCKYVYGTPRDGGITYDD